MYSNNAPNLDLKSGGGFSLKFIKEPIINVGYKEMSKGYFWGEKVRFSPTQMSY